MIDLLEILMIVCFGVSWPVSIYKSVKSRTAKGKSLLFEVIIWLGYVFGITRKLLQLSAGKAEGFLFYLALVFYVLNILEISADIILYFRNARLDKAAENNEKTEKYA